MNVDRAGQARWTQNETFFVSYTAADRAWAEWLAWEINAAGYTTLLQAWDMPPGTAFVHAMDQAVRHTRHTVLVLSEAYLRSPMTEAEWRPGFLTDPSGIQRRLLPVRVEPCEVKGLLADRVYVDLVGLDEATTRATLLDGVAKAIRGPGPPTTGPRFPPARAAAVGRPRFPTSVPPVWNVPYRRNPNFTGRNGELAALAAALEQGATVAVTQVLQGGGGVGKTALATEYAYRHRSQFDTVWWVRAEEPTSLVGDYADLAMALGSPEAGQADQQVAAAAVRGWLEAHDRWLLVLDNADSPDTPTGLPTPLARLIDLIPQVLHGQVVVTSRDASWEDHAGLAELEVFTPAEAVAFLAARVDSTDQATATEVSELLGFLPLALEQAGAYVRETRLSLAAYRDRLRRFPSLTMTKGRPRDRDPKDTIATTWQLSVERVYPTRGTVAMLEVCAFLGPEAIPRDLFAQHLDLAGTDLAVLAEDRFALDDAVAALRRFGLVKADAQSLTIHRLLQQVVDSSLDDARKSARVGVAVGLVTQALPDGAYEDPGSWPTCARLLPHALAATDHAVQLGIEPHATAKVLGNAASYLRGRARYADARTVSERALAVREAHLGPDHPDTAASLYNLANVLRDEGDLAAARPLHERALAIFETRLGPDHPITAWSLSGLAAVLREQGDLADARRLHERALAIREARLGPDHHLTAASVHNLANVLRDQGDLAGARRLHERALAVRETQLGPDHPDTIKSRRLLTALTSKLKEAE